MLIFVIALLLILSNNIYAILQENDSNILKKYIIINGREFHFNFYNSCWNREPSVLSSRNKSFLIFSIKTCVLNVIITSMVLNISINCNI